MAKRKKLKLKIDGFLYLAVIIILVVLAKKGINYYHEYQYHKTTEYKLITVGYSKKDIKLLSKYYNEKELLELTKNKKNTTLLSLMSNDKYLHKNLAEYQEYADLNSNKTTDEIIQIVNIHRNHEYYEYSLDTDLSKEYAIIVNKYYHLSSDYEPDDLATISTKYSWGTLGSQKVRQEAYDAYIEMHQAAQAEANIYLMVNSSYRKYSDQERVYNEYKKNHGEAYADSIAARPGYSEHQTGLALDIFSLNSSAQATFKDSDAYKWLLDNSYKYGFILRYPENKENITGYNFESWHYRYVGKDLAKKIYESGLTFDEYYAYYLEK